MMYVKFPIFTKFMFFNPSGKEGDTFKFCSDLEKIGLEWDVALANGTYVDVISEPIDIIRPKYGTLSVIKIRADVAIDYHTIIKELWVPTVCIHKVENNETKSSQLSN